MEWNDKLRNFTGCILILLLFSYCESGENGALKFVTNLYKNYQGNSEGFSSIHPASIDTIYSPEFLSAIRLYEQVEQEGLGYDPVCNCQDDNGFKMEKIEIKVEKGRTLANVSFTIQDVKLSVVLKLTKKHEKWFIDDVVNERGSLHEALKEK